MMELSQSAFLQACREEMGEERLRAGIGTLGEKTQHAVLKRFFGPEPESREVRVGPYVADVFGPEGIVEIQTRGFDRLRDKLDYFLQAAPVTVVYPVPAVKWLVRVQEDGTAGTRRKSPKRPGFCEILPELYRIKPLLGREGLRFCVLLLETEEFRLKRPEIKVGRRRTVCFERMPIRLLDALWLERPADYSRLLPPGLPGEFTVRDFTRPAKLSRQKAQAALNVLRTVGAVELAGKRAGLTSIRLAGCPKTPRVCLKTPENRLFVQ